MHGFVNSFGPCSVKMDVCVQDAPDIGNMVIHTEGPATACNLIFTADSGTICTLRNMPGGHFYSPEQLVNSVIACARITFSFRLVT